MDKKVVVTRNKYDKTVSIDIVRTYPACEYGLEEEVLAICTCLNHEGQKSLLEFASQLIEDYIDPDKLEEK